MIKLHDFATMQGVTDRQIQRLLKKYAEELEGLFERKGQNGTWLSDEACDILRSKMKTQPLAIFEEDPRLARLQEENDQLRKQLDSANEDFRKYVTSTAEALTKANEQLRLAEQAEAYQKKAAEAEEAREQAEKQAISLRQKNVEIETALTSAEEEKKTLSDVAEMNAQEAEQAKHEADALRAELEKIKKRSLWQRIINK